MSEPACDHAHDWSPIPEMNARYSCACGATGYRKTWGPRKGEIVEHVNKVSARRPTRALPQFTSLGHHRAGKRGPGGWSR